MRIGSKTRKPFVTEEVRAVNSHSTPPAKQHSLIRWNLQLARAKWKTALSSEAERALRGYSEQLSLSVEGGDLLLIDGKWYVTHSGLLRIATRRRCCGIAVTAMPRLCDPSSSRWAFRQSRRQPQPDHCRLGRAGHEFHSSRHVDGVERHRGGGPRRTILRPHRYHDVIGVRPSG